ncbi:MAG: VWA domain-containing protein [Verrucomicrobiales bacterium]
MFDNLLIASPWYLLLLLLLPLVAWLRARRGLHAAVAFSSLHILRDLGSRVRSRPRGLQLSWILLPLLLSVLAMARPQLATVYETIKESGVEMIVAIDISRSMLVEDFTIGGARVTRLQAAKKVTREFIEGRETDRIGMVAFAGRPYLASPITLDHNWLIESMDRVRIGLVEDGTAIGSAIAASARRLDNRKAESKVIVLLTDGANNSGNLTPSTAAQLAKTLGIKVYTIAVGTHGQHRIPMPRGTAVIRQEFDEETLKTIAEISDGEYFRAQDTSSLERIFRIIDELEKSEISRRTTVETEELYPWLLGSAFFSSLFLFVARDTFARKLP